VSDWRIDELAQRAGVAVDTIRYYQREGLLTSGERNGRTRRFGPEHLEQLERVRALQARRFSLAAIRALLERDDPGALAGLLQGSEEATYDHDELIDAAGVSAELVRDLTDAGLLRDPAEHGRSAYDADDVNVLRSFADLGKLAIPDAVLVEVARIYACGLDEIQRQLASLFTDVQKCGWDPVAVERFRATFSREIDRFARDVRVVADYTQQRNLQRAVLQKIAQHAPPAGEVS
jgi:MerR HTH family regulatory protein